MLQGMSEWGNPKTKQLIDDWSRGSADQLVQSAQGVDAKMVGVLAAGSVVIGVAVTALEDGFPLTLSLVPLCVALVCYFVILLAAFFCLTPKDYRRPTNPVILQKNYRSLEPAEASKKHSDFVLQAFKLNKAILDNKTKMLRWGLFALALETIGIVTWTILGALNL